MIRNYKEEPSLRALFKQNKLYATGPAVCLALAAFGPEGLLAGVALFTTFTVMLINRSSKTQPQSVQEKKLKLVQAYFAGATLALSFVCPKIISSFPENEIIEPRLNVEQDVFTPIWGGKDKVNKEKFYALNNRNRFSWKYAPMEGIDRADVTVLRRDEKGVLVEMHKNNETGAELLLLTRENGTLRAQKLDVKADGPK